MLIMLLALLVSITSVEIYLLESSTCESHIFVGCPQLLYLYIAITFLRCPCCIVGNKLLIDVYFIAGLLGYGNFGTRS